MKLKINHFHDFYLIVYHFPHLKEFWWYVGETDGNLEERLLCRLREWGVNSQRTEGSDPSLFMVELNAEILKAETHRECEQGLLVMIKNYLKKIGAQNWVCKNIKKQRSAKSKFGLEEMISKNYFHKGKSLQEYISSHNAPLSLDVANSMQFCKTLKKSPSHLSFKEIMHNRLFKKS